MLNNNFATVEYDKVLAMVYTNLSHESLLSFVWMKLFEIQGDRDMRGIKETQKLKLGDSQGIPR